MYKEFMSLWMTHTTKIHMEVIINVRDDSFFEIKQTVIIWKFH